MSLKNHLINLFKGNVSLKDVWYYIQGNYRYMLYYSKFRFLIRKHIRRQIALRILVMNEECYSNGECIKCGCATTALQMCNKACAGMCYPKMMNWYQWDYFNEFKIVNIDGWYWELKEDKLIKSKSK